MTHDITYDNAEYNADVEAHYAAEAKRGSASAAWYLLANRLARGQWEGTGLCWEIDQMSGTTIPTVVADAMKAQIRYHMRAQFERSVFPDPSSYYHAWYPENDADVRILACVMLAMDAANEIDTGFTDSDEMALVLGQTLVRHARNRARIHVRNAGERAGG